MCKRSCLSALLVAGLFSLSAQTAWYPEKVDSNLWKKIQSGASAEFLVILTEQADVRGADRFRKKEDKGRYVYETLLATAERSQTPVRERLRQAGAPVQSFWIINSIWSAGRFELVLELADMPEVARLEDNPTWHLSRPPEADLEPAVPDRTFTAGSWGLTQINADDVWNLGYTGAGVVVGGQDTGYEWEHPALKEKYRGWDGATVNHNYSWHDAIHALIGTGSNSCGLNLMAPCDDNFHGTHTMGTMVGSTSSNYAVGVAPDAQWVGCRNMEEGDGTPATYIECFQWLAAPTNLNNTNANPAFAPHVINNSWGCPPSEGCNSSNFATMETVITNVQAAGILVVTSAGNSGSNCSTVSDPPSIYSVSFAVGATNSSDGIASFSSRGPVSVYGPPNLKKPNVSAPGMGINSCIGTDNNPGTYSFTTLNGTSMAGPHVAGLAALVMSARPDLIGQVAALKTLIQTTCTPRYATAPFCGGDNSSTLPNNVFGYGRVDALAAVNAALALPVELVSFSVEAQGQTALLHWATATETNCAWFEIQQSTDAVHWTALGKVPCSALSHSLTSYDYTDATPAPGLNYYRLKQIDLSGAYMFSSIVSLRFGAAGVQLRVAAHPRRGEAFFEVLGAASGETWRLAVVAADGRELLSTDIESMRTLAFSDLPHGVYPVLLRDERGKVVASNKMVW